MFDKVNLCEKMSLFIVKYSQDKVTNDLYNNFKWDKKNSPEIFQEMIIFTTYCMGYSFWRLADNPFDDEDIIDIMEEVIYPISIGLHSVNNGWTALNDSKKIEKLINDNMSNIKETHKKLMETYIEKKDEYDKYDPMDSVMDTVLFKNQLNLNLSFLIFDDFVNEEKEVKDKLLRFSDTYPQLVIDDTTEFLMEKILPLHEKYNMNN